MTDHRIGPDGSAAHERRRLRLARNIFLVGVVLGVTGAGVSGGLGFDGRVGFGMLLAGTALGSVVAALTTVLLAIVDEAQKRPVPLGRMIVGLGLFALGALLIFLVVALPSSGAVA